MQPNNELFKNSCKQKNNVKANKEVILSMQTETMKSQIEKIAQVHQINLNNSNWSF